MAIVDDNHNSYLTIMDDHTQLLLLFGWMSGKRCWRRIRLHKSLIKANIATPLREPDRPLTNDARRHSTCVTQTRCHQKMQVGGLAENYQQNVDIIFNKSKNWSCKMWYRCTLRVLETPLDLIRCQEILWELKITIRCWQYVDNIYNIGNIVKDGLSGNL